MAVQTKESNDPAGTLHHLLSRIKAGEELDMAKYYNDWSKSYDQDLGVMNYRGPDLASAKMADLCPNKGISILECGTGTGLVGEALKARGFTNITGVDISQDSIDIAEKKGCYKKLLLLACDEKRLPFDDNSFDCLVGIGVLGHGHIQPVALCDWTRVVKQGGLMVMTIRQFYFENGHEYGKVFKAQIKDLVDSGKIRQESKDFTPELWKDAPGYVYTFKIL